MPATIADKYCPLVKRTLTALSGYRRLTLAMMVRGKHIDPVKNMSLYHCMAFLKLITICWAFLLEPVRSQMYVQLWPFRTLQK